VPTYATPLPDLAKIGTPVTPALGNIGTNFGLSVVYWCAILD